MESKASSSTPDDGNLQNSQQLWLDAWYDPLVNLHAFSGSMCLAQDKLLVGDLAGTLKVYHNGRVQTNIKLNAVPTAVCSYSEESISGNNIPGPVLVAVACGPSVKIFRNFKPYFKFNVPPAKIAPAEVEIWRNLKSGKLTIGDACRQLRAQSNVSQRSLDLLALEADPDRQQRYLSEELEDGSFDEPLTTCITCMAVLFKSDRTRVEDSSGQGSLVLGTESRKILILDSQSRQVVKSITLRSEPMCMAITGSKEVEYRIVVACRDNRIYSIRNGDLVRNCIEMDSPICGGLARIGRDIIFACANRTVHSYHIKGRKNWTMHMPEDVTNITPFECLRRSATGFFVALRSGEVRLYMEKTLVTKISPSQEGVAVTGLTFGQFNREVDTLVALYTNGAISVKMLKRTANLDPSKVPVPGPPPEQDIPLVIPKKTKLYVDQTQRERENGAEMHRLFQHSLCKLRYLTARSYLRLFQTAGVANAQLYTSSHHHVARTDDRKPRLNMSVSVQGLGPQFRIIMEIENLAAIPLHSALASLFYDRDFFHVESPFLQLPVLIPQVLQSFHIDVYSLVPGAEAPPLYVNIIRDPMTLLVAEVQMPIVEG